MHKSQSIWQQQAANPVWKLLPANELLYVLLSDQKAKAKLLLRDTWQFLVLRPKGDIFPHKFVRGEDFSVLYNNNLDSLDSNTVDIVRAHSSGPYVHKEK